MADIKKFAVDAAIAKVKADVAREALVVIEHMNNAAAAVIREIEDHVKQVDAIAKAVHVADLLREAKLAYVTEFVAAGQQISGMSGLPRLVGLPVALRDNWGEIRLSETYYSPEELLPAGKYRVIVLVTAVAN